MRVVQLGDPVLRMKASRLIEANIRSAATILTVRRMKSVMQGMKQISPRHGNGLAAPQVGDSRRLIVLFFEDEFNVIINPEIIGRSPSLFEVPEGCLSFFYLRAPVLRNESIKVKYVNEHNQEIVKEFEGHLSALLQHEIDHLDGILYLDRVKDTKTINSVYYLLRDEPERLLAVRRMIDYLTGKDEV